MSRILRAAIVPSSEEGLPRRSNNYHATSSYRRGGGGQVSAADQTAGPPPAAPNSGSTIFVSRRGQPLLEGGDKGPSFRIPASTSNLGAGFDALSLAVNRYLEISLQPADSFSITATGMNADSIPKGPENLIRRVASSVAAKRNRSLPQFHMHIANEIPLARGLGSSAAAIIAGITSYELMTGDRLSDDEIFRYAYEFEPHPDNLAAALYGGLITAATSATGATWVAKLTVAAGATPVVVIPDFKLSTAKARAVLPNSYSRRDAVYNIQRSALTIAALTTGQWSMLREAMRDRIHQPYRAKLIPGLDEILALEIPGLLAVALSGAGPTVFALAEPSRTEVVGQTIADVFSRFGVKATAHNLEIDTKGRVIT